MSNTDLTNKLGVNPDVHEGKAVLVSYKTPAVSLIVKFSKSLVDDRVKKKF
jgi:hypothetical protein